MRRAKIVATIGPTTDSEAMLRRLILAGVDVARINMSHGDRKHHAETIAGIRSIASELDRPVAVLLDVSGPKIRTGELRDKEVTLEDKAEVHITTEQIRGDASRFSANYPALAEEVRAGDRILIGDGEIELRVEGSTGTDIVAQVVHGGILGEHKGINLPGAHLSTPSITEKDRADLDFGIGQGVDLVAQSFVRSASDCRLARELIARFGGGARLIAKIEKPEAVEDLSNILDVVDGVMVARGDLAIETSPEMVPVLQKRIISEALLAQKGSITATQMLQSMIENPRPTRAEASDVSNAILDGSDAVMLSGETAVGRYPVETVTMMDRIIRTTEEMRPGSEESLREAVFGRRSGSYGRAIAEAALFAADEIGCRMIVVITRSGHMARRVAALRPRQRIIALTPEESSHRQLNVTWGVEPHRLEQCTQSTPELLALVDRALLSKEIASRDETVVVMAGRWDDPTVSLTMKVHRVGELTPSS
jgi:pyruvate kinase